MVRDVAAFMVQKPPDTVFRYAARPTNGGVAAAQCMIGQDSVFCQSVTAYVPHRARKNPTFGVLRVESAANSACTPEASQHGPAQDQVKCSIFASLRFRNANAFALEVELRPLELD
jgi:hypothetical protein